MSNENVGWSINNQNTDLRQGQSIKKYPYWLFGFQSVVTVGILVFGPYSV